MLCGCWRCRTDGTDVGQRTAQLASYWKIFYRLKEEEGGHLSCGGSATVRFGSGQVLLGSQPGETEQTTRSHWAEAMGLWVRPVRNETL